MYIIAYLYISYNIVSVETVANLACRTVLSYGHPTRSAFLTFLHRLSWHYNLAKKVPRSLTKH